MHGQNHIKNTEYYLFVKYYYSPQSNNIWGINNIQCITLVVLYGLWCYLFDELCCTPRAVPRHAVAPGRPMTWRPFKLIFFKLEDGWRKFMRMCAEISCNFQRNCFAYAKLSLLTQLFSLNHLKYQRSLQLGDPSAARLVHPLIRSGLCTLSLCESKTFVRWRKFLRSSRSVFLNRRAAAQYRALTSIIQGRERFSWYLSFQFSKHFLWINIL